MVDCFLVKNICRMLVCPSIILIKTHHHGLSSLFSSMESLIDQPSDHQVLNSHAHDPWIIPIERGHPVMTSSIFTCKLEPPPQLQPKGPSTSLLRWPRTYSAISRSSLLAPLDRI
ncbi:hypothetical protein BDV06DRAFT_206781 [Aspergillus oleicola]